MAVTLKSRYALLCDVKLDRFIVWNKFIDKKNLKVIKIHRILFYFNTYRKLKGGLSFKIKSFHILLYFIAI